MWLTNHVGIMARRLLVNWHIDPVEAQHALPPGVRPVLVAGKAIAGLCLVRLEQLRPQGLPAWLGLTSENVAARMGVEWDTPAGVQKAVLIFRRDTASRVNAVLAPRVGYGAHALGQMNVREDTETVRVHMHSRDRLHSLDVKVRNATRLHPATVFHDLSVAETFFRGGECGYSPSREAGVWQGARLRLERWGLEPMVIDQARSSLIERLFPHSAELDSAFIMRNIPHTWSACGALRFDHASPPSKVSPVAIAA